MTDLRRDELIRALPYARRYARALTSSQPGGDALVAASLPELIAQPAAEFGMRVALFHEVTRRFDAGEHRKAMSGLSPKQRQLLLLTSLEDMTVQQAAYVVGLDPGLAAAQLADARDRLRAAAATDVLIIEDEPIIAMDLENLVTELGHTVVAVAATKDEAVAKAHSERPGLVLADINLGEGGSGIDAVSEILSAFDIPVIFITAYPEKLLTGERPEPTYLIAKPFLPETVQATVGQALFFHPVAKQAAA